MERSLRLSIIIAFITAATLFSVTTLAGFLIVPADIASSIMQDIGTLLDPLKTTSPLFIFLFVFINNTVKAFFELVLGVLLGIPAIIFITINGFIFGAVISFIVPLKGWLFIIAGLLPHGIIEIPMILISTTLSLIIGWETLKWLFRKKSNIKSRLIFGLRAFSIIVLPGLLLAALIEAFVTPAIVQLVING